jgi:hypothetical protein
MSRRVYLLGVGIVLVAGALALTDAALKPAPGVMETAASRIKKGMTRGEVHGLLGRPNWTVGPFFGGSGVEHSGPCDFWYADEGTALVSFDRARRAVLFSFAPSLRPGPLARLRAWLGW